MDNYNKYISLFTSLFGCNEEEAVHLKYQDIPEWDSVGHMSLVAEIENTFDIVMDIDDIIDFSSFDKGKSILTDKYNVDFGEA